MASKHRWLKESTTQFNDLMAAAKQAQTTRLAADDPKSSRQEGLFKQVKKAIDLLLENSKHPSLNTHEYSSIPHPWDPDAKVWEAYAQIKTPGAYRIFWCYGPNRGEITIIAITPHP